MLEAMAAKFSQLHKSKALGVRNFATLISLIASIPIYGQIRVWEGTLDLPAYEEGAGPKSTL